MDGPVRRIRDRRTVKDAGGVEMEIVTLECGHEQIGGAPYRERRCVECRDEAKYGKPPKEPPAP